MSIIGLVIMYYNYYVNINIRLRYLILSSE